MHDRWKLDTFQTIVWNYLVCSLGCYLLLGNETGLHPIHAGINHWLPLITGVFFISGFYLIATSVQKYGLTLATLYQKMSVVIPISVAILFFHESAAPFKLIGILLALVAIFLSSEKDEENKSGFKIAPVLLGTFFLSGGIDLSFYYAQKAGINAAGEIPYIASIFSTAAVIGVTLMIAGIVLNKIKFSVRNIIGGLTLGIPNIFSLIFLTRSLDSSIEGSLVFPMLNVGILIAAAVIDPLLFKQDLSSRKKWSVGVAILSIACMALVAYGINR